MRRHLKRLSALALAAALAMTVCVPAMANLVEGEDPVVQDDIMLLSDVVPTNRPADLDEGAWWYKAALFCLDSYLMKGTNVGFEPDAEVTTATVYQVLYNRDGAAAPEGDPAVTTPEGAWYADCINWAAAQGLFEGTEYAADAAADRQGILDIVTAYCKLNEWSADGLMEGDQNGNMMLDKTLTRAEFAQILMNLEKSIVRQKNIAVVTGFYEDVFNAHSVEKLDDYMLDNYMQHNATVEDGKEGFIKFTEMFFGLKPKMEILKVFANDDHEVAVFFKCTCEANGMVNKVVDIYRLEDGMLAEHWDVVEHDVGNVEPANGRDLFATDAEGTKTPGAKAQQKNIDAVVAFNEEVFNAHSVEKLDEFMQDDYMQHNATVADKKEGFVAFTDFFFTLEPTMKIYKTFANADGEVMVFFKCTCGANGMVNKVVDIYRLRDGKLAEHWDVVEHDVGSVEPVNGHDLFE